jgi:hypothetical protein
VLRAGENPPRRNRGAAPGQLKTINPDYSFTYHVSRLPFQKLADVARIAQVLGKAPICRTDTDSRTRPTIGSPTQEVSRFYQSLP